MWNDGKLGVRNDGKLGVRNEQRTVVPLCGLHQASGPYVASKAVIVTVPDSDFRLVQDRVRRGMEQQCSLAKPEHQETIPACLWKEPGKMGMLQ